MESGEDDEAGKIMLAGGVEDGATPGVPGAGATWDIIRLSWSQFIMTRYYNVSPGRQEITRVILRLESNH